MHYWPVATVKRDEFEKEAMLGIVVTSVVWCCLLFCDLCHVIRETECNICSYMFSFSGVVQKLLKVFADLDGFSLFRECNSFLDR